MASEIMAIPITSVASEANFSARGRVIDPSRASLGQKTIEAYFARKIGYKIIMV
ncbi:Putative AC9 transposase [Linum perenne]